MANITLDFLHNYHTGERRESDPAYAYQYDEGHVIEAVLPSVVTTVELHYWIRGMEEAEAYAPTSITPNDDNSCTVLGNIPNKYFETNGELRIYIVVNDASASITTYEGKLNICQRSKPDDYVDDDPDNEATRVLVEARAAAETATEAAQTAQDVADSIPADYSQMSADVTQLKEEISHIGGLSEDIKQALLQIASKVVYIDEHGKNYYDALENALYPPADLVSISCVYTQTVTVYTDTSLEDLRNDLVVTAHFDDSSTRTISQYALSGTLEVGTSTITVSYGGKTTSFDVVVERGLDYTEDALADVTWNDGYGYNTSTGVLTTRSGAYATDKFNVQDLSYSVKNLDTTNNTNYYIFVWDENNNYLGNKQYSDARFQWKPGYQIAIEVRNAGTFDPTTMTMLPYDKRSTAVSEFEIDLASMADSVVKVNGYYELNVNAVMANAGVNSSNYNDTINRQSIIGMINQAVNTNNFPFKAPIRIGTFNYGSNMLLSIFVEGITVSDANLPTLKAYLVDNNVKIKYNY